MQLTDPNLTILLDMPAELVAQRKQGEDVSRFDAMPLYFHQKLRTVYLERAKAEPRRIKIVDAIKPVDEVHAAVLSLVEPLLK
jgi:dTMP kinase